MRRQTNIVPWSEYCWEEQHHVETHSEERRNYMIHTDADFSATNIVIVNIFQSFK